MPWDLTNLSKSVSLTSSLKGQFARFSKAYLAEYIGN
jgi:hypothetical protein